MREKFFISLFVKVYILMIYDKVLSFPSRRRKRVDDFLLWSEEEIFLLTNINLLWSRKHSKIIPSISCACMSKAIYFFSFLLSLCFWVMALWSVVEDDNTSGERENLYGKIFGANPRKWKFVKEFLCFNLFMKNFDGISQKNSKNALMPIFCVSIWNGNRFHNRGKTQVSKEKQLFLTFLNWK